jgi:hypothetical protein
LRLRSVALLVLMLMGFSGCDEETCNADNCPGCCSEDGTCQAGDENAACGFAGAACSACTGITTCSAARVCGNPVCRPATCATFGRSCGDSSDGCGGVLRCGSCDGSRVCTAFNASGAETWQCGIPCSPACAAGTACTTEGVCSAELSKLTFNQTVKTIAPKLRINGVEVTKNATACSTTVSPNDVVAVVRWSDAAQNISGSHQILCKHPDFALSLRLAPGSYAIRIDPGPAAERAGALLPWGGWTSAAPLQVSAGAAQPDPKAHFDVTGFSTVQGRLRINGAAPVQNPFCTDVANAAAVVAQVELFNRGTGASSGADITCTSPNFSFCTRLVAGRYDVRLRPGPSATQAGSTDVRSCLASGPAN